MAEPRRTHHPRKRFGQHFLSPSWASKLVAAIAPRDTETFLEIGKAENARAYIDNLVKRHGRLMGVGHRIYRVEDPRMRHLRKQFLALSAEGAEQWHEVAEEVGRVILEHPHFVERKLNPNVEFYSAPLLYGLGLPLDLFTVAFAMSRVGDGILDFRETGFEAPNAALTVIVEALVLVVLAGAAVATARATSSPRS